MILLTISLVYSYVYASLTFKQQLQQSLYQVHVSLELIPETVKVKNNKMRIIGNDMGIKKKSR